MAERVKTATLTKLDSENTNNNNKVCCTLLSCLMHDEPAPDVVTLSQAFISFFWDYQ